MGRACALSSEIKSLLKTDEGLAVSECIALLEDIRDEAYFADIGRRAYAREVMRRYGGRSVFIEQTPERRAYRDEKLLTAIQAVQLMCEDGTKALGLIRNVSRMRRLLQGLKKDMRIGQGHLFIMQTVRDALREAQGELDLRDLEGLGRQAAQG